MKIEETRFPLDFKLMRHRRADFPTNFQFGTATSAYQIEGHQAGGAGSTHWDSFAATPGNVVDRADGARACDHYHRVEEDLDLVKAAGFDAYRFSTSWARVIPNGIGVVNQTGLDFYDRLVDAICARGIDPFLTLYHWELPSPLADRGGWSNPDVSEWFAEFTDVIVRRLGDRVHAISPINEPWCVAWLSHFEGAHAPGLRDVRAASRAMHHVLVAHGKSVQAMRALGQTNVGAVLNFEYATSSTENDRDIRATAIYDGIYNRWFADALFKGSYPEIVVTGLEPYLPDGWHNDFDVIAAPLDWVGVNYYTRKIIAATDDDAFPGYREVSGTLAKTTMDWEIYPEGLTHFLTRLHTEYVSDLPIFVTENGMSANDTVINGAVVDGERIEFIDAHLDAVRRAIDAGVNVAGYFVWSLLDNYEWALGYQKRFGIVHVDFDTLERTPKASHAAIANALRR